MKTYANVGWTPEDVQTLFNVTDEEAIAFLEKNYKHIRDRLVEVGFEVIETLGHCDNLPKLLVSKNLDLISGKSPDKQYDDGVGLNPWDETTD